MILPSGPNSRKDRNKIPPSGSGEFEIGGAGRKCLEGVVLVPPIVKSKPLRVPPLYPVRLVELRCESTDFLGARWKCLLGFFCKKKSGQQELENNTI